jgi:catechol 2,3-dioxygenase-like lactoylglutathione lyase family enzyme
MTKAVDALLAHYETGRLSRRDLVAALAALAAAPAANAASATLQARSLNHVSLIVANLDRSVAFYQRVFGLAVASRQSGGVNLRVGAAFLGLYQAGANGTPQINHFCLGLANFDAERTARALAAEGLQAESRVRDGVPQLYCADPDNLRVQLQDASFCGGTGPLGNVCQ